MLPRTLKWVYGKIGTTIRSHSRKNPEIPTYIVSFPKCGRTWLRLMLGKIFQLHFDLGEFHVDRLLEIQKFSKKYSQVPTVRMSHGKALTGQSVFWRKPDELSIPPEAFGNIKVILLVRDPRDVVVSAYFEKSRRRTDKPDEGRKRAYTGTLSEYIKEEVGSFDTILAFYDLWEKNRHIPVDFLLLRYEDMREDTYRELRRVLNFLGLENVRDEFVMQAIDFSSFEKMQAYERDQNVRSHRLAQGDPHDENSFKVRKGKVGGFREYLDRKDIDYLDMKMRQKLSDYYGYEI